MTEAEWNACTDPGPMLEFLRGKVSDRKLRLFSVGCCRRVWHSMEDERSRRAVEMAERFVDGHCSREELDLAWRNSWVPTASRHVARSAASAASAASTWYDDEDIYRWLEEGVTIPAEQIERAMGLARQRAEQAAAWKAAQSVLKPAASAAATRTEVQTQADLLHEIVGNAFRPASLDSAWLTPTVKQLAESIYEERGFDRLPILADALEDAGCTDADILSHCRKPGEHCRGCWVVDLLLGKE
jgi:hypothetical protein